MTNVAQKTTYLIVLTTMLLAILWVSPAYAQREVAPAPVEVAPVEPEVPTIKGLRNIDVRVEGEHLVFASGEDVEAFLELVTNKDDAFLDSVEAALGYESLRTAENVALDAGENAEETASKRSSDADVTVVDPYFATALGADAKIQIDNIVSLVTSDYVYSVEVRQADLLNEVEDGQVGREVEVQSRGDEEVAMRSPQACSYFNSKHRLCGKTTRTVIPLWILNYTSVSGRTYAQEKKCILWGAICWWRSENISRIGLEANFDLDECWSGMGCNPIPETSASKSATNASSTSKTYTWAIGWGIMPCYEGSANTHHTGTKSGVSKSLDTDGNWNDC